MTENKTRKPRLLIYSALCMVLCLGWLVFFPGCGGSDNKKGPNVLLISIDTLRRDHMSLYGYPLPTTPTLDRLAQEGVHFNNAVTRAPWTLPAHMSVMTGLPPALHQVRERGQSRPQSIRTLAEIMKKNGYKTGGVASGGFLAACYGFERGFDYYEVMPKESGKVVTDKALKWLAKNEIKDNRFFMFLHYFDAHWPYHPPQEYASIFGVSTDDWKYGDWEYVKQFSYADNPIPPDVKKKMIALYDGGIRCADDQIRRVLNFLEKEKRLDNTIVIAFSDHGEEFNEHGNFGHGHSFYKEMIDVFLAMRYPPTIKAGSVVPQAVVTSDIPMTLFKMLDIKPPQQFLAHSVDLLAYNTKGGKNKTGDRAIIMETTDRGPNRVAVIQKGLKYIPAYAFNAYRYHEKDEKTWYRSPEGLFKIDGDENVTAGTTAAADQKATLLKAQQGKYIKQYSTELQLSFLPAHNRTDTYEGFVRFDAKLKDEPGFLNFEESDNITPIKKVKKINFNVKVDKRRKKLLFTLPRKAKKITLLIRRNGQVLYDNTMDLPKPQKEVLLGVKNLDNGGCTLEGSAFYRNPNQKKVKLTKEQVDNLKSLGYL